MTIRWGIAAARGLYMPILCSLTNCIHTKNFTRRHWGIVTAGKSCHDFVNAVNSFPEKGDQEIVAIAARDRFRAEEFADTHNIPTVFDSYEDMALSTDVTDVVYIGALNPDHFALSKLFLENGKHVLCEKPMCLNLKQAQALVNIAKRKKLFLMEGVWSRFAPAYHALEEEIVPEKIGDVKLVEVNYGLPIVTMERLNKRSLGGGALLDLGIYVLQFAQFVFKDEPTNVTVIGVLNEDGVDIIDHMILEYSGGRRAILNVDITIRLWNKATVTGTKGRTTLGDPFCFPEESTLVDGTVARFPLHKSNIPYNWENSPGLVYEAIEVARCIREGLLESPRMTHRDSLALAKLEDTVRRQVGVHFDADDEQFS